MSLEENFKANLLNARNCVGLSQAKMSEKLGVKVQTYQNWEHNVKVMPGISDLVKICSFFNLTADDMLCKKLEFKFK